MALEIRSFSERSDELTPWSKHSIVRGHAHRLTSSISLGWKHIFVERHIVDPGEKEETVSNCHIVVMSNGKEVCYGERPGRRGHMVPYQKEPGAINLYEEGVQPPLHPFTATDLTVCALDKTFVKNVSKELGRESGPTQKIGFSDSSMQRLMTLLIDEAKSGGLSGASYVDHLAYALATKMLLAGSGAKVAQLPDEPLPYHRLQRVIRLMEANLDKDLSLGVLASESGYSRSHFLRMFRSSTGDTPHHYLVFLRLEKAKAMMKNSKATLMQVAIECGFCSHAHFTRSFQQALNVTPSYYRRHI
jgi:AraC family transcriptional regulator